MTVHVCWLTLREGTPPRFYWDQWWLEELTAGDLWPLGDLPAFAHHEGSGAVDAVPAGEGAVVVVPARSHAELADAVAEKVARLPWLLLILTGDEEASFNRRAVAHPNMRAWVQTPRPGHAVEGDRRLGDYWPPRCRQLLAGMADEVDAKPTLWAFAGQVNNPRRQQAAAAMRSRRRRRWREGELLTTAGFTLGVEYPDYLRMLARAKVAPCPPGCFTPDSFRVFEALEAGCVPVVDAVSPAWGDEGYWAFLFGRPPPFPVLADWAELPDAVDWVTGDWPASSNRVQAWWAARKRDLACWLVDDLVALGAPMAAPTDPARLVTALIPTSPIPSHPSTAVLEETVASIRERLGCEVVLMVDGVRAEQDGRRPAYEEYQRRLFNLARRWGGVLPLRFEEHRHQAAMTAAAMRHVRTPLVLFVEHDTPLCGDNVEWGALADVLLSGEVNLVRFLHETHVLPEHRHLVVGVNAHMFGDTPLIKTLQWSQRPHLARSDFYRRMLAENFGPASRTMIEDRMHGVVHCDAADLGRYRAWRRWRLTIYQPPGGGSIKRSTHLDGREGDPKYEMDFGVAKT